VAVVPTVTLYGKPGCHLCDDARAEIERIRADHRFELEQVDITLDPALNRRYGERIPVLALDGEELFELHVNGTALRERLDKVAP
jgi:glutaredoxin